jgi:glutamate dehydrogenase/leucine dehydrogenase
MKVDFSIHDPSLVDDIGPEKIVIIRNPQTKLNSVLVIDNSVYGIPAGGVRLAKDISLDEIIRLSRAMSLKFCSYKMKVGGAKAGIWGDPLNLGEKSILLTSFAKSIERYVKNDVYYPGPDMATDDDDLLKMFRVMGAPNLAPNKIGMIKHGIPVEELFTGYGVMYCTRVIHQNLKKDKLQSPRILLEGFGKVGTAIALSIAELGFSLNGVSTIEGAIFDEDGLDIEKLVALKKQYGDKLVHHYNSKNLVKTEKENLFNLSSEYDIDFIIPGARPDVINNKNIDKLDVTAIIPAANIPYEKGIIEKLEERNIIAFPDFVANAGEILAILVNKVAKSPDEIFQYIQEKISQKTMEVLEKSNQLGISPYKYAENDALKELTKKLDRNKRNLEKLDKRY